MVYKKIGKILLAHGLPNAQHLLAPLDFYLPWMTGRVEMSNPVLGPNGLMIKIRGF